MQRSVGTGILAFSIVALLLATVLLAFGMAPVGIVILAVVPMAWLGAWLRRHGSDRLNTLQRD
jgi:hypothetical protein